MPPKGWRKNGESTQLPKETELVSIDEILFPRSTVQKLAKSILNPSADTPVPENMSLAKDSLIAVQRSATVFVSHLMFHAQQTARDLGRKNVNSQDVLHALERADLAGFVPEVKQKLSTFEAEADAKKKLKLDAKDAAAAGAPNSDEPAPKKRRDNSSNSVLQTGAAATEDEDEDEGEDADNDDDVNEDENENVTVNGNDGDDDDTIEEDETRNDDATVLPPEGNEDEETVAPNPIALLGQEEQELNGLDPNESTTEVNHEQENPETDEE